MGTTNGLIFLRRDQSWSKLFNKCQNENVTIYAPEWMNTALSIIGTHLSNSTFHICNGDGSRTSEKLQIGEQLDLRQLAAIARNEPSNVTGAIKFSNYENIKERGIIYSLKDLVKHCVIIGEDTTENYGGYGSRLTQQNSKVYVCDLAGLQFQLKHNSGRLVLIERKRITGLLDDFIFQNVVHEKKATFEEITKNCSNRYIKLSDDCYFDSLAYKKFVTNDVILTAKALNEHVKQNEDQLNFKFLKYGTGYFAGSYKIREQLEKNILDAVIDGLEIVFENKQADSIRSVEFTFYNFSQQQKSRFQSICNRHHKEFAINKDDGLKQRGSYITATTNCADPHAVMGNEMGYSSVDAAIAQNLRNKGNYFSPTLNQKMKMKFIDTTTDLAKTTSTTTSSYSTSISSDTTVSSKLES